MDDDYVEKYENLPDDIEPKRGHFVFEIGAYSVSKADAKERAQNMDLPQL